MATVKEAIDKLIQSNSDDTSVVSGLSRQIITQMNDLEPSILVNFESLPGLQTSVESRVNFYLQSTAKEYLRAALRESLRKNTSVKLKVNSAFRSTVQQHILHQLSIRAPRIIPLAAKPGNSNHENGLAIDINDHAIWQHYLEDHGWHWFGKGDPVHFHFAAPTVRHDIGTLGVKAFQTLWNRFNPNDLMTVDGNFGAQTAARMDRSPVGGFVMVTLFRLGDSGAVVTRIQQNLINAGFATPITGTFDQKTQDAVIKFQIDRGLKGDGAAGPMTLRALGIKL